MDQTTVTVSPAERLAVYRGHGKIVPVGGVRTYGYVTQCHWDGIKLNPVGNGWAHDTDEVHALERQRYAEMMAVRHP